MRGEHVFKQGGARTREADKEDVRFRVPSARPLQRGVLPRLRIGLFEPSRQPLSMSPEAFDFAVENYFAVM